MAEPKHQAVIRCSVCKDFEVCKQVNRLLINRVSVRKIASRFPGLNYHSVQRHKVKCCAQRLANAWKRREVLLQVDAESILTSLVGNVNRAQSILALAEPAAIQGLLKADPQAAAAVINAFNGTTREHRAGLESEDALLRLSESRGLTSITWNVVYGQRRVTDLPQQPPRAPTLPGYRIVREQKPAEVIAEVMRDEEPEPPEQPPPQRRLPPPPTSAVVVESPEQRGMPSGWNAVLAGRKL
jgi:hypothetical protein